MSVHYYGCVKCQTFHYEDESIYQDHINFQSKHGIMRITAQERETMQASTGARSMVKYDSRLHMGSMEAQEILKNSEYTFHITLNRNCDYEFEIRSPDNAACVKSFPALGAPSVSDSPYEHVVSRDEVKKLIKVIEINRSRGSDLGR